MKIKTIKQFDENSNYYAVIVNRINSRNAELEKEITAMKVLNEAANKKDLLDKKKLEEALLEYADNNQDAILPEGSKTYTNAFVKLTIKMNPPKLSFLTGIKEADVINKLKEVFKKKASRFITVKETISKSVVLKAAKSDEISEEQLEELGMQTKQNTTITITPL